MATYNSGKNYNSSTNYGAGATSVGGAVQWQVLVDWDNNGTLDSTNESNYLVNLDIERGRRAYFAQQGGGFEHVRPGRVVLTMDNTNRRYDPRYASSPLYPNVKPGRLIYVAAIDTSTGTAYPVFRGLIDDIAPLNAPGGGQVQIIAVDFMAQLNDQSLDSSTAQNITLSAALNDLLTDAGYPGTIALDTDSQPIILYGVTDRNAGQVAHQIADAGMGTFLVDVHGRARFFARGHNYGAAVAIGQAEILNTPVVSQPWADVYNHVTAVTERPIKLQPSAVYFLPGPVQLTATVQKSLKVSYQDSFDVQVRAYTVNSAKDGSGTDLTANTTVTATLGHSSGTVRVTCTSNGWLTKLEIAGRQWGTVVERQTAEDATSQAAYGMRRFVLDSPFLQDPNYAENHAGVIKDFAKNDRESITIQIEARPVAQFYPDLMQKITLTIAALDINDSYYVMGLRHQWAHGAQGAVTTMYLDKVIIDTTSVTAAEVLSEPAQAPPDYTGPPGGGGGLGGGAIGGIGLTQPGYFQAVFDTGIYGSLGSLVSGGFVSWADNPTRDISVATVATTPYYSSGPVISPLNRSLVIMPAGVWYVEFWVTNNMTTQDRVEGYNEVLLTDGSGVTNYYTTGTGRVLFYSTSAGQLTANYHTSRASGIFNVIQGQALRCRVSVYDGLACGVLTAFRIG